MKLYNRIPMSLDAWRRDRVEPEYEWYANERYGYDLPPAWDRQQEELDRLCAAWPTGEFLSYLTTLAEMSAVEIRACHRAIYSGTLRGERTIYGYVTSQEDLAAWVADRRASRRSGDLRRIRRLAQMPSDEWGLPVPDGRRGTGIVWPLAKGW